MRAAPRTSQRNGANSPASRRTRRSSVALSIREAVAPERRHTRVALRRVDPPEAFGRSHLVTVDCFASAQDGGKDVEAEIGRTVGRDEVHDLRLEHDHAGADPLARRLLRLRLLDKAYDPTVVAPL